MSDVDGDNLWWATGYSIRQQLVLGSTKAIVALILRLPGYAALSDDESLEERYRYLCIAAESLQRTFDKKTRPSQVRRLPAAVRLQLAARKRELFSRTPAEDWDESWPVLVGVRRPGQPHESLPSPAANVLVLDPGDLDDDASFLISLVATGLLHAGVLESATPHLYGDEQLW